MHKSAKIWLLLAALVAAGAFAAASLRDTDALCGGRRYAIDTVDNGASPYVRLSAGGLRGEFLLDYGATRGSLSAAAFGGPDGGLINADVSLPGVENGPILLKRYDMPLQPMGGKLGVVGTDMLSGLSVQITGSAAFIGAEPCAPGASRAKNLAPIAQDGFFSSGAASNAGRPNVPVVFFSLGDVRAWAQIDTGYDDVLFAHSVDINQPLFDRLTASGMALDHIADISVATCEGRENRSVYAVKNRLLQIETEKAAPIVRIKTFHLILKPVNGCGGIAAMTAPAAQLGASFLKAFETIVFDPKGGAVWIKSAASVQ